MLLLRGGPVEGEVLLHGGGEVRDADVLVVAVRDGDAARTADGLVHEVRQVRRIAAEGHALGRQSLDGPVPRRRVAPAGGDGEAIKCCTAI